jgi:hypothetical protein
LDSRWQEFLNRDGRHDQAFGDKQNKTRQYANKIKFKGDTDKTIWFLEVNAIGSCASSSTFDQTMG